MCNMLYVGSIPNTCYPFCSNQSLYFEGISYNFIHLKTAEFSTRASL